MERRRAMKWRLMVLLCTILVFSLFANGFEFPSVNKGKLTSEINIQKNNYDIEECFFAPFITTTHEVFSQIFPNTPYELLSYEYFAQNTSRFKIMQIKVRTQAQVRRIGEEDFVELGNCYIMQFYNTNEWTLQKIGPVPLKMSRNPKIKSGHFVYDIETLKQFNSIMSFFTKQVVPFRLERCFEPHSFFKLTF